VLGAGVSVPRSSVAAPVSVGLLGIDGAGVEPGMGQALTETLHRHLPTLQGMRVEKSQQDLVEVKLVFGCVDENPVCMAKVGKSLSVDRLIYGSIRKQPQSGLYVVAIKQLNVADSTVEKFITEAVPPEVLSLDNPQLNELVQRWLRVLLIEGLRGGLRVLSEPAGASVQLDGVPIGQTPLNLQEVEVGDHLLQVDLPGYVSMSRSIRIRGGQVHEVMATLVLHGAGAARAGKGPSSNRILRITSYVAAGLAGATALAAIGTWRGYIGAEDSANNSLDQIQHRLTGTPGVANMYKPFFGSSTQLSSCAMVAGLQSDPNYQAYLSSCQSGNTLAQATTALWVVAGGFAVISIATALLSSLRHPPAAEPVQESIVPASPAPAQGTTAPSQGAAPAAPDAPAAAPGAPAAAPGAPAAAPAGPPTAHNTGLKLVDIIPAVGSQGAALSAQFRF
jgi:hypothetical protein